MSDRQEWDAEVSSLLKNIYRCADKYSWYSSVAEAYNRTRPRYPAKIWAFVEEIAQLNPSKSVLEIGCGPGIASVDLAKFGVNLKCLEPSPTACAIARRNCKAYPLVDVENITFEEWDLAEQKFDLVVATTSYHWLAPEIRNQKTAAALKKGGLLILMWNTPPQPSYEVHQSLAEVYQTFAPELAKYEPHQNHEQNLAKIGQEVIDSGYFGNLVAEKVVSQVNYTVEDYLTLLTTLSPYIRLEAQQRKLLIAELQRVLKQNYGSSLELKYLSLVQIAQQV